MTRLVALVVGVVLLLAGCSLASESTPTSDHSAVTPESEDRETGGGETGHRRPVVGQCYALRYRDALSPVSVRAPVPCRARHTSVSFHVGQLPGRLDGRRAAVDSSRTRAWVSRTCRERLGPFLAADERSLRLSMLSPVWFTASLEEASSGGRWFRCDAVVLGATRSLVRLPGRLRGSYTGDSDVPRRLSMCGTAAPDSPRFRRVPCGRDHSWRAVGSVDLPGETHPGAERISSVMDTVCADRARETTADPLRVTWAIEGPTRERWRAGQHYGLCWAPSP